MACACVQVQGLVWAMGGPQTVAAAVQEHGVVLAAHGACTAASVNQVLGLPVPVVAPNSAMFDALVSALEEHWASKQVVHEPCMQEACMSAV